LLISLCAGVLHVGAPSGPEVTLRLHLNVKTNNCMEPGIGFSDPQCSGKGKCITQSSVVMISDHNKCYLFSYFLFLENWKASITTLDLCYCFSFQSAFRFVCFLSRVSVNICWCVFKCESQDTFYCQCDDGYSGIFCEEFDACHLKPCENNGTCTDLRQRDEGQNYSCTCQPGVWACVCFSHSQKLCREMKDKTTPVPASQVCERVCVFQSFSETVQRDERQNYSCTCQPGVWACVCVSVILR